MSYYQIIDGRRHYNCLQRDGEWISSPEPDRSLLTVVPLVSNSRYAREDSLQIPPTLDRLVMKSMIVLGARNVLHISENFNTVNKTYYSVMKNRFNGYHGTITTENFDRIFDGADNDTLTGLRDPANLMVLVNDMSIFRAIDNLASMRRYYILL